MLTTNFRQHACVCFKTSSIFKALRLKNKWILTRRKDTERILDMSNDPRWRVLMHTLSFKAGLIIYSVSAFNAIHKTQLLTRLSTLDALSSVGKLLQNNFSNTSQILINVSKKHEWVALIPIYLMLPRIALRSFGAHLFPVFTLYFTPIKGMSHSPPNY